MLVCIIVFVVIAARLIVRVIVWIQLVCSIVLIWVTGHFLHLLICSVFYFCVQIDWFCYCQILQKYSESSLEKSRCLGVKPLLFHILPECSIRIRERSSSIAIVFFIRFLSHAIHLLVWCLHFHVYYDRIISCQIFQKRVATIFEILYRLNPGQSSSISVRFLFYVDLA